MGVLKLREPGRWLRNGAVLGVLLARRVSRSRPRACSSPRWPPACSWCLVARPRPTGPRRGSRAPTVLAALAVTAVVAGALLAYPLYMHFAGPQTFAGTGFNQRHYVEDLVAYLSYPDRSLAGWAGLGSSWLAPNPTEETSFLGSAADGAWSVVVRWSCCGGARDAGRRATLRALGVVAAVFLVLSWGPRCRSCAPTPICRCRTRCWPGCRCSTRRCPPGSRSVVSCVVGVVLALIADRLLTAHGRRAARSRSPPRSAVALVPLHPAAGSDHRAGARAGVHRRGALARLRPGRRCDDARCRSPSTCRRTRSAGRPTRWPAAGRSSVCRTATSSDRAAGTATAGIGAPWRRTDWLFFRAAAYGYVAAIDDADRAAARSDFAYWGIDAVFLPDQISGQGGMLFRAAVRDRRDRPARPAATRRRRAGVADPARVWTRSPGR